MLAFFAIFLLSDYTNDEISMEDKDLLILRSQYHDGWCPGDPSS